MAEDAQACMIDVAFALSAPGPADLPRAHADLLAQALEARLPWLAAEAASAPAPGVHRLRLSAGGGAQPLLSQRTRLVLRVPRERLADTLALQGAELAIGPARLHVGAALTREMLPWGTLYAHCVATPEGQDEASFLSEVQRELERLQVQGRAICGRAQALGAGRLQGYSLMVDGLAAGQALRLLERGLGGHRRLGCGLFVPHRSAAAVGAPP